MQAGRSNKAWQWALWSLSLFLQQEPGFCPHPSAQGIPEKKLGTARPWSNPPTGPHNLQPHPSHVQGYKMDDLLTSYVQQLLSVVNKQRGARASAPADS